MQECDLLRIRNETQKYLEVDNIFSRLQQGSMQRIFGLFKDIFESEHQYTITVILQNIQELLKLAVQKEIPLKDFKLAEHYKLNSHIFKSNLQLIIGVVVEDLWVHFNKQVQLEELKLTEQRLLTQIDEEAELRHSETFEQPKISPRQSDRLCQSSRVPLTSILQNFQPTTHSKVQTTTSSPSKYLEQLQKTKNTLQITKKKHTVKNKSLDIDYKSTDQNKPPTSPKYLTSKIMNRNQSILTTLLSHRN